MDDKKIRYSIDELQEFVLKASQALKESEMMQITGKGQQERRVKEINELTADTLYIIDQKAS